MVLISPMEFPWIFPIEPEAIPQGWLHSRPCTFRASPSRIASVSSARSWRQLCASFHAARRGFVAGSHTVLRGDFLRFLADMTYWMEMWWIINGYLMTIWIYLMDMIFVYLEWIYLPIWSSRWWISLLPSGCLTLLRCSQNWQFMVRFCGLSPRKELGPVGIVYPLVALIYIYVYYVCVWLCVYYFMYNLSSYKYIYIHTHSNFQTRRKVETLKTLEINGNYVMW